ncbi:uncharacterized protein VTP21DRAFT_5575 [Calcarisporiella thermophila]|uniref:uncharacterized protein n=1 Tax=Calcarisporiella thermophila TaxID=911321 RepID=UPI003742C091
MAPTALGTLSRSPTEVKLRRTSSFALLRWLRPDISQIASRDHYSLPSPNSSAAMVPGENDLLLRILRSWCFRVLFITYAILSFFLTTFHLFTKPWPDYLLRSHKSAYQLQRVYDPWEPYSLLSNMSNSYRFSKLFSKALPPLRSMEPFYIRGEITPESDDVSIALVVDIRQVDSLVRFANNWPGPISALVHLGDKSEATKMQLYHLKNLHRTNIAMRKHVDIHLLIDEARGKKFPTALNLRRNIARFFARTEFVAQFEHNTWPLTDFRATFRQGAKYYHPLLRAGDVFVLPTFSYSKNATTREVPTTKTAVLRLVRKGQLAMNDLRWKPGKGPTDFGRWKSSTDLYPIEQLDMHFEANVVMVKSLPHWCPERFHDQRASCLYGAYLSGSEFWVLPFDFVLQGSQSSRLLFDIAQIGDLPIKVTLDERLYQQYFPELCMHHALRLYALGLWGTPRTRHLEKQCKNALRTWGKELLA